MNAKKTLRARDRKLPINTGVRHVKKNRKRGRIRHNRIANTRSSKNELERTAQEMIENLKQASSSSYKAIKSCREFIMVDGLTKGGFKNISQVFNKYNLLIIDQKLAYKLYHSAFVEETLEIKTGLISWTVLVLLTKKTKEHWLEIWSIAKKLRQEEIRHQGKTNGCKYPTGKNVTEAKKIILLKTTKRTSKDKKEIWISEKALDDITKKFPGNIQLIRKIMMSDKKLIEMCYNISKRMPTDIKTYRKEIANYFS